ncbi:hypothetical protein GQS52_09405 [Streptomyces sp. SCUT-3]|uniref:hypothetical protein n=1 Tax=Streptomyces sp. SCUT-3 TaxID=2684469 RepID=UPI000CB38CCA|nr:hypothetical protein [Streptomyces sp. SCUT-3]PLW66519.1 hypothetical protein C0036_22310 [Streptomyces sp. DJ]QMV21961.1 hypothetical protein GQS52_09405 [Streptomyces sp. SCUT-3]
MDIRLTTKARRRLVAVVMAASVAFTVAGCGGEEDSGKTKDSPKASSGQSKEPVKDPSEEPESEEVLARIKGADGVVVTITSAQRDSGGFVTVNGQLENTGEDMFTAGLWRGQETELLKNGASTAGAVLVDKAGKKKYFVLRDTDGGCLCTTGLNAIKPGEKRDIFAQFPAPPEDVTEVDFQLPTMPPATIAISG